ncbi:MAG TPA: hypothetical protein VN449_10065, partial [Gaiellaceae bacterium]|nr:hypothetical protein [Gaiellaceae bacterium]
MALSRTQRNDVFRIIAAEGLDAGDFDRQVAVFRYRGTEAVLRHRPTDALFEFVYDDEEWWAHYEPGATTPEEHVRT